MKNNIFKNSTAEEVRKFNPIVCYSLCSLWPSLEKNIFLMTLYDFSGLC